MAKCVGCGTQGELQGVARDGLDERADGPAQTGGDGSGEGDGLELQIEASVALLPGPVGVGAPEEAVLLLGGERVFAGGAGGFDFGDPGAA